MKTFIEFAAEYGVLIDTVIEDGKIHRVPIEGKNPRNKSGAYCFFNDENGRAGWIRNHITGVTAKYGEQADSFYSDPKTVAEYQKKKDEVEKELKIQHNRIAKKASFLVGLFHETKDNHKYLVRKGVKAHKGLKIDNNGDLILPLSNVDGNIRTFQNIFKNGSKGYLKNSELLGNFFTIGEINPQGLVIICEGYSTGASLYEITGIATIVVTSVHNLRPVVIKIRERYADIEIVVAGDNDYPLELKCIENVGVLRAKEAANSVGGIAIIPEFTAEEKKKGNIDCIYTFMEECYDCV